MGFNRSVLFFAGACCSPVLVLGCSSDFGSAPLAEDDGAAEPLAESAPSEPKRELERVRKFLDSRYAPNEVRHSFHTKFGETIDCVDFFAQPGVKALAARGTPITELPAPAAQPKVPDALKDILFTGTPDDEGQPRACPRDSVPILRVTSKEIHAAGGLDAFVAAHHHKVIPRQIAKKMGVQPPSVDYAGYAHVQQDYTGSEPVIAARATINVARPSVVAPGDHSIMQTWLVDGRSGTLQTVEVGTNVAPLLYGDRNTHFFIFATNNNYGNGCYNDVSGAPSDCLPWIGSPGAALTPGMTLTTSTFNGVQAELQLLIYFYGGWNISDAGYYPSTDFAGPMSTGSASWFSVGGEVYDMTKSWYVPMGSGADVRAGFGQAAYWNAPGEEGLSIIDINGIFDTTSFGTPTSERPSDYIATTGFGDGRVYVGPELKGFFNHNYGYQWSAIGDWAPGSYKAQCDYNRGVPLKGVAVSPDGTSSEAILCGDYIQAGVGNQCYVRSFANGDNRPSLESTQWDPGPGHDWDPGFVKGECGYREVASGIAQSTSHQLNAILCCSEGNNADHASCTVENFDSSNSPSFGAGPDWAYGFNKGVCPVGKAVVGISRKSTGAAHALLCCHMD